nr:hypothetical protein [Bacteroidota bacterium]
MAFHEQILKDNNGNELGVFLPISDYEKMLQQIEELEDIKDFDEARAKNEETILLKEAIKLRKRKNG